MDRKPSSTSRGLAAWTAYTLAVAITLATLLLRLALGVAFGERPLLILFVFPIIVSAHVGGLGPGLVATAIASAGTLFFLIPPTYSLSILKPHDVIQWLMLVLGGVMISTLSQALRRSRERASASQQLHAATLASIGDGLVTTDGSGRVTFLNAEAQRLLGWPAAEAVSRPISEVFELRGAVSGPGLDRQVEELLGRGGRGLRGEALLRDRGGRELPIALSGAPIVDGQGAAIGSVLVFRDLSEQKEAENALRESEEKYRQLVVNAPSGIYEIDLVNNKIISVNDVMCLYTGYSKEEFLNLDPRQLLSQPSAEVFRRRQEMIASGQDVSPSVELQIRLKDDRLLWVLLNVSIRRLPSGEVVASVVAHDIAERKQTEEELRVSEERFRLLFTGSPDAIFLTRPDGQIVAANPEACRLFGYEESEFTTLGRGGVMDATDPRLARILAEREAQGWTRGECRAIRKGGEIFPVELSSRLYIDGRGETTTCIILRDISERQRAADEKEITSQMLHLINSAKSKDDLLRSVLARLQEWSGCEAVGIRFQAGDDYPYYETSGLPQEFVQLESRLCAQGPSGEILRDEHGAPVLECMCGNILQGRFDPAQPFFTQGGSFWSNGTSAMLAASTEADRQSATRNRCNAWGYESVALVPIRSGGFTFGLLQFNDKKTGCFSVDRIALFERLADNLATSLAKMHVEEEKNLLELSLRQAHKLQAVGTLASGIAHEFNNLLATVLGYSELILEAASDRRDIQSDVAQVIKASERGRDLVLQLLAFSQKSEQQARPIDLNAEIAASREMLARLLPKSIALTTRLAPDLRRASIAPSHVGQVLVNLATNAAQAMPDGGKLSIATENVTLPPMVCPTCAETISGDFVALMVSDTGKGMDQETLQRVFEPFFSTREIGSGTGLGLSVVQGLIQSHGGHIVCDSEVGRGTTFKIYVPVYPTEPGEDREEPEIAPTQGSETILLIDDEEALRSLGARHLSAMGYTVLPAASGEEALELYRKHQGEIAAVVLDLGMPGMGGHKCLAEILTLNPEAKVLVASGYTTDGQDKQALDAGAAAFVAKPYRRDELATAIRDVLDGVIAPLLIRPGAAGRS